jgi:hypothetical protein
MSELLVSEEAIEEHGKYIINSDGQDGFWRG